MNWLFLSRKKITAFLLNSLKIYLTFGIDLFKSFLIDEGDRLGYFSDACIYTLRNLFEQ